MNTTRRQNQLPTDRPLQYIGPMPSNQPRYEQQWHTATSCSRAMLLDTFGTKAST